LGIRETIQTQALCGGIIVKRGRQKTALESAVQADIEAEIGAEPDLLLMRNTVGMVRYFDERTGEARYVTYGLGEGSPDLVAILAPWGRVLGFEVKADDGRVSGAQMKCHDIWHRFGALIFVVRSRSEARNAVNEARRISRHG
jgi:hypothetical protein